MKLPTLYYKNKQGKLCQWRTWTEGQHVFTEYGQVGGKLQESSKACFTTNEGRSNERSPEEQAKFEAMAMQKFKITRKYTLSKSDAEKVNILPMLIAKSWATHKIDVEYPVDIQRKYDGVRALCEHDGSTVRFISRSGRDYKAPKHIAKEVLKWLEPGEMVDGELYSHGVKCTDIAGFAKKKQEGSDRLEYHVYDVCIAKPWPTRREYLKIMFKRCELKHIKRVLTSTVDYEGGVEKLTKKFIEEGYEGAVLRFHRSEGYEFGHRSRNLMKVKTFQDAEFKVVNVVEGRGKMKGCAIFDCKTKEGNIFGVVCEGTMEERREQYKNRKKYIGKMLKVKFHHYTNDGIPFHPVGIGIRIKEDM